MKRFALLAGLALVAAACLGSDFEDSIEGSWQLTSGSVDGEAVPVLDSHPITIEFDGEQVSGTAACNGYSGTYEQSGAQVEFGALAMTEMACMPEEVMEAERAFSTALTLVDTASISDDGTLSLSGGGANLSFEPAGS